MHCYSIQIIPQIIKIQIFAAHNVSAYRINLKTALLFHLHQSNLSYLHNQLTVKIKIPPTIKRTRLLSQV